MCRAEISYGRPYSDVFDIFVVLRASEEDVMAVDRDAGGIHLYCYMI